MDNGLVVLDSDARGNLLRLLPVGHDDVAGEDQIDGHHGRYKAVNYIA